MTDEQIEKIKQYCKDHAPEIITACAAVCLVLMARGQIRKAIKFEKNMLNLIMLFKDSDIPFEFYPGIGIQWHEADVPEVTQALIRAALK